MNVLKQKPQWVMWKYEVSKERRVKVLYSAKTKHRCGANQAYAGRWVTYDEAVLVAKECEMEGVGVVIPKGYVAFDFDHCNPDDPMIVRAHELLPSYTEKSPSGTGEHVICKVDPSRLPQVNGEWDEEYYKKTRISTLKCMPGISQAGM